MTEYVQVLLPTGQDVSYDLTVTAYAQEKGNGNPDEASASAAQHIGINFNHNETQKNFLAEDQSIWGTGDAFSVGKDFFFGANEIFDIDLLVDGHFKAGFTADLLIQGGEIDAHIPVNTIIDTTYNTTTDSLLIHTNALLAATGGDFTTTGPEGHFDLGFLIDILVDAGLLTDGPQTYSTTLSVFPATVPNPFSSEHDAITVSFGQSQIKLEWPHLSVTNETQTNNEIAGDNASNNFIELVRGYR